nr:hypothetical protein [Tanacetum cinerariifolium]
MSLLFADTHNVAAILEKSDVAEGFEQIINFLSGSYIHYALTMSPHIYISCIKHFWNSVSVKRSGDVTRLQDLVDKKKIVISEAVIREILQLNDVEGMVCLSNEEIFIGLAQMGYEKPSTKVTFYKAFFSSQWKFLIHTILQSLSAKRTSWNEFSTAMASAVICLSKGQRFNFSKYIFDSLVRNMDISSKFYMYSRFIQLIIQAQVGDLSTHTTRFISPALTQKVFANMRRVGKGFSGVETPLFEGMITDRQPTEEQLGAERVLVDAAIVKDVVEDVAEDVAHRLEIVKLKVRVKKLEQTDKVKSLKLRRLRKVGASRQVESSDDMEDVFNQGRMMNEDEGIELEDDSEVQDVVEVVTTAKLITEVVTAAALQGSAASATIPAASATIPAAKPTIPAAAPTIVTAYTRRRKGVIIRDPEEELPLKTPAETPKKAAKRRKLSEEVQEAEDLRKRLEVVEDEDDDVFVEATPLAQKIVLIANKPRFKIIRVDETHQLYISFTTLLKNFDREDLETLWRIVKDRFSTSKPTNFSDEYLLLTLRTMFKEPDGQDAIWRNQKSVYGLALVKRWKLLTSCGVHVITLSTV